MGWRLGVLAILSSVVACSTSQQAATPTDAGADARDEAPRAPSSVAIDDLVGIAASPSGFPVGSDANAKMHRAFFLSKLQEMGVHRMRREIFLADVELARGSFDFAAYDALLGDARLDGIEVLALLAYGAPWASSAPGADAYYPPDDPRDFADYATAVAQRYGAQIDDYEIWNEPNVGFRFWKPTLNGDPAAYGELALLGARAVSAADPGAHVAFGGTAYHDFVMGPDFTAQAFAATPGLAKAVSAFAAHTYEIYPPTRPPESDQSYEVPLVDKIGVLSAVLDRTGGAGGAPFWITEIGWPVIDGEVSPQQQARFTVRAILLAALAGSDRVYLYTLEDGPHPEAYPPEDAFGLLGYHADYSDGSAPPEKPAFVAVRTLCTTLRGFHVTRRIGAEPADAYLLELSDARLRSAFVAWRADEGAPPIMMTVPATGVVRVVSLEGVEGTVDAGSHGVVLQVGNDPQIVAP